MGWEEDILSHIAPTGKRKKKNKYNSDSESDDEYKAQNSDLDPIDSADEEEDAEWAEVKSWNKTDLMGDAKDRKRLFSMSELEREMELAERRKKFDALEERNILQKRLKSQSSAQSDRKLTERERKGQQLEKLRKKRESKASKSRTFDSSAKKRKKGYSDDEEEEEAEYSDYYQDYEDEKEAQTVKYEDVLSIQLRRDDAETWLYKPDFEKSIKGCFARLSLGTQSSAYGGAREPVYRCVYIAEAPEYHRKYRINKTFTKTAINVSHGKAKKQYLMDMLSNQPITTKEWNRFEVMAKVDKVSLPSMNHIKRKQEELQKIKDHIFSEEEFNEMLKKKKELNQAVVNTTFERIRMTTLLESALEVGDTDKVEDLKLMLKDLDQIDDANRVTSGEDLLAKLNAKNRVNNLKDSQQAEKAQLEMKRKQGVSESDPFARRKTAPVHVINAVEKKRKSIQELEISNSISKSLSAEDIEASDGEDPLDSVDVSILEGDLGL